MENKKQKNTDDIASKIINLFASAKLTLIIIALLAVISFFGTTQREFNVLGMYFDFRDVYHQAYYQILLGLLFTNLLVCTIDRFPTTIKRYKTDAGPKAPPPPRQENYSFRFKKSRPKDILERAGKIVFGPGAKPLLREMGVHRKKSKKKITAHIAFSAVGRLSILGPLITHIGILILLIGGIYGGRNYFQGYMWLSNGASDNWVEVEGKDKKVDLGFTILCNDFTVTFYENNPNMASDYLCDISIIENGKEVDRKTIQVNQPLYHNGYGIFQASYQYRPEMEKPVKAGPPQSMDIELDIPWTFDGGTFMAKAFEPHATGMGRDLGASVEIYLIKNNETIGGAKLFENYPNREGDVIGNWKISFKSGQGNFKKGLQVTYTPVSMSADSGQGGYETGLQVIKDPGVPLVWTGCALLIIGSIIAFIVQHQRIWLVALQKGNDVELLLIGRSKKAKQMLEKKLEKISQRIEKEMKP